MSKQHLLVKSHAITDMSWWYEENAGISVIVHPQPTCQSLRISWVALRAALARKDRKP